MPFSACFSESILIWMTNLTGLERTLSGGLDLHIPDWWATVCVWRTLWWAAPESLRASYWPLFVFRCMPLRLVGEFSAWCHTDCSTPLRLSLWLILWGKWMFYSLWSLGSSHCGVLVDPHTRKNTPRLDKLVVCGCYEAGLSGTEEPGLLDIMDNASHPLH